MCVGVCVSACCVKTIKYCINADNALMHYIQLTCTMQNYFGKAANLIEFMITITK